MKRNSEYSHQNGQLPRLPGSFWRICGQLTRLAGLMQDLLDLEWQAISGQEVHKIGMCARKKAEIVQRIERVEERFAKVADNILERVGSSPEPDRWSAFIRVMNYHDLHRFQKWHASYRLAKHGFFVRNQRHLRWVREQLLMARDVTRILAGFQDRGTSTYNAAGRMDGENPESGLPLGAF